MVDLVQTDCSGRNSASVCFGSSLSSGFLAFATESWLRDSMVDFRGRWLSYSFRGNFLDFVVLYSFLATWLGTQRRKEEKNMSLNCGFERVANNCFF